ncbi:MAG: LacI family DNA-binding transcriptional regulator [Chthoniobacteraceae bacterium]
MSSIRRVTLSDVAREANVHVTTVSMALRDHPRLPEETKKRLKELAEKMGYSPDPLLSALSTYRTRSKSPRYQSTIAYLTNWTTEWGWKQATAHLEFYNGAKVMAQELGFMLEHFWLHAPNITETRLNRVLRTRGITGLILASHGREMGDALNLDWSNFCCVKIDYFPHEPLVHNVTNHQSDIVRLAMRRVTQLGYRRIGFVMHRGWDHAVDHNWIAGFLCEQQQLGVKGRVPAFIYPGMHPVKNWLLENESTVVPNAKDFKAWLDRYKPDIILSKGAFVRPVLKTLEMSVPHDVAFVDLFLSDFSGGTSRCPSKPRNSGCARGRDYLRSTKPQQTRHSRVPNHYICRRNMVRWRKLPGPFCGELQIGRSNVATSVFLLRGWNGRKMRGPNGSGFPASRRRKLSS